ncbi:diacylglycerol kinase [Microbacterium sp.]|uniref:diacylglycerol kinase n=1 Tax=Microbacterium sp. TaxID=51671 RepID=UPI003A9324D9
MRVAIVANPAARAGAHSDAADRAAGRLRTRGITTSIISGGSAADTTTLLKAALEIGVDGVLVAGGDGTVNLALQQVAGTGVPLGIIPIGTGNDFAAVLGLRELDVDAAADVVAAGRTRDVDLARITRADGSTALFGTVLASGFDARVNDRANRMRWPRGSSRYTIATLVEFLTLHGVAFALELEHADGRVERVQRDLVLAAVGNGPSYGGGIPICPDADLGDGLLDVTVVTPAGRARLLRLLPRLYRGRHTTVPEVTTYRVRGIRLDAAAATAYADGDPVGTLPLRVDAAPGALRVFSR